MAVGRIAAAASVVALGLAGWELQRRRDLRAVQADPEWHELNRAIAGRPRTVTSDDGAQLHVEVFGDEAAPPIVLVHGWTFAIEFWHYQVRDLAKEFRVVAYDQRGHGRSDVPADAKSYSERRLAADLNAVIDACLRPGERFAIAGHSMGGMTIVAWAGLNPAEAERRLTGVALINTGMSQMVARLLVLGPRAGAGVHRIIVAPLQGIESRLPARLPARLTPVSYRLVRRLVAAADASPGRVAFAHQLISACPAPVRAGFGRLLAGLDLTESVLHLSAPAVVIAGDEDKLLPPWHSERLAATLPHVLEHVVLPKVGHMAPLEAPQEVTPRIARIAPARPLAGKRLAADRGQHLA